MIYTPEQIREMLDAATPGPWGANEWYNTDEGGWAAVGPHHQVTHEEAMDGLDDEPDGISHERAKADAQIIAAAPTIIRELLTENERLRGVLEEDGFRHCEGCGQYTDDFASGDVDYEAYCMNCYEKATHECSDCSFRTSSPLDFENKCGMSGCCGDLVARAALEQAELDAMRDAIAAKADQLRAALGDGK